MVTHIKNSPCVKKKHIGTCQTQRGEEIVNKRINQQGDNRNGKLKTSLEKCICIYFLHIKIF